MPGSRPKLMLPKTLVQIGGQPVVVGDVPEVGLASATAAGATEVLVGGTSVALAIAGIPGKFTGSGTSTGKREERVALPPVAQ